MTPCPICGVPFDPRPPPGRTLRRTCSRACGQRRAAQLGTRTTARAVADEPRRRRVTSGFAIVELTGGRVPRRYVPRVWESYHEARLELLCLLRPYPRDSAWRKKLEVRAC